MKHIKPFYFFTRQILLLCIFPCSLFAQVEQLSSREQRELRLKNSKISLAARQNNIQNLLSTFTVTPANAVTHPLVNIIQSLVGPGVSVSNVQTNIPDTHQDSFHIYGSFSGGLNVVGLDNGLLITTGSVENALGPNSEPWKSQDNGLPGYLPSDTAGFDAALISFDVSSATPFLSFKYVFASDEYNEYVGSPFNDAFAFFISGPGIPAGTNIALIPGTTIPVAINNVNLGLNAQYYLDNDSAANANGLADPFRFQNLEYDGLTRVLTTAAITVVPGATYRITLVIQDFEDAIYDSGVFIEGGSITGNPCVLGLSAEKNDISCYGAQDGSIELYYYGATGTPGFVWSNGATTQEIEHLGPGIYNVIATDGQGCTSTLAVPVVITEPAAINLAQPIVSNASCSAGNLGSATVSASGGTSPYQYTIGSITNGTGSFIDLAAGPYNYLVTDARGCTQGGSFVIPVVSEINCAITVSIDPTIPGQPANTIFTGYGTQMATLTGIANSGTGPYTYDWGSAGSGSSITVSPVVTTTYTLIVTDQNGCQSSCSITIYVSDIRCGNKNILLCHRDVTLQTWETLCVNPRAAAAHLGHGDYLGTCIPVTTFRSGISAAASRTMPGEQSLGLTAYPNPSSMHFTLKIQSPKTKEKVSLRILDLKGRQVEQINNLNPGQVIVLGNNYKAGIYFAELVQGTERKMLKLVKYAK